MRIVPFALFCLLCLWGTSTSVQGQEHWARRVGAWSNDAYNAIVVDGQGSIYVIGEFGLTVNAGGTILSSAGSTDILVAKYDAQGNIVWARSFGGPGLDRGIALALGPDGGLAIVGQFMGEVTMGSDVLSSAGGTQDVFVAYLDDVNGAVLWARQAGGPDGVDQPSGVSVSADGDIAVTGEFRGNAIFGGTTLTSVLDPDDGLPSVDIFVVSYSADGSMQWVKHGAAKYADRGVDLVHDAAGNIYVTGQFSDTLTFDLTHNTSLYSAVFVVRFSPQGTEEWFSVMGGGTYNNVFDIDLMQEDALLLTGDIQGTVIFLDAEPDLFTAVAPRSSFLVEVDLAGQFVRQLTWGSDNVVNTRSVAVTDDEIAVLGRFQCQFTGFSAIHGSGTWLATGQHDLYVARFDLDSLYLKGAQQFGGQRNKVPGGIAYAPDHEPLFCGAFDRLLVFPAIPGGFSTTPQENGVSSADGGDFCSDPYYGSYVGLRGGALMDAFIARGYVAARSPYDIFTRTGGDCDRPALDVALRLGSVGVLGPDSVAICDHGYLNVNTNTAYIPDTAARHNAPDLSFQWSTGSQYDTTHVLVTGWYRCTVTSNAGCWQRTDSIHVTVNPLPAIPLISDDVIVNTAALQAETVSGCEPFSPWLWTTTAPGNTVVWSGASGSVMNDSIQATNSGSHYVSVTTPAGCSAINVVQVNIVPAGELPAIEMEYEVTFPQDTDMNDTIMICSNLPVSAIAEVELFLGGSSIGLPYGVRLLYNCNDGSWTESHNGSLVVACGIDYGAEGWYSMTIGVMLTNAPCGTDTLIAYRTGTVYIIPYPVILPQPLVSAPDFLCPGDTTSVLLDCVDCQQIVWTGPGIVENYTDSIRVVSAGYFGVVVTNVDTNGCVSSRSSSDQIQWNLRPLLGVLPTDGIICPDSSALIFSDTQGTDYQWYGPSGPLSVVNDTITTTQQGVYYLEMVDATGCFVTSDPVLVTDYATPYLNVLPDNSLCEEGETATLQVVTTGSSSFQWLAPLSGNAFQQVVDEAGIYRCSVNACGITTELSVEIFGNEALAELLQPGPFSICPDDTIALEAVPGMASYYWYPGPVFGTTLSVSEGGTYTLVTSDQQGCEASLVVEVNEIPWTETLVVSDTAICVGTPLVLSVPGSGIVTWFADPLMTEVIGTGNTLDLGTLSADTTVHVQQAENGCTSALRQIHVSVFAWPEVPEITGPDTLCAGTELVLSVIAEAGLSYEWITPAGLMEGSTIVIPDVSASDAGSYVLQVGNPACSVSGDPHSVTVLELFALVLSPDTTICPGGVAMFTLPDGFTDPTWSDGSTGSQFETSLEGPVTLTASGPNGCRSTGISFVNVYAFSQIVSAQPVTICLGNDATMTGSGSGLLQWFADPGLIELVTTGPQLFLSQPLDSTVFQLVQTEGGCVSMPLAVPLNVVPIPVDVTMVAPSDVCVGAPLTISLEGGPGLNATWVTPVGPAIGVELFYPVASLLNDGVYTAVPAIGPCAGDTISASINVLTPAVLDIGPDTVLCDGGQLVITLPTGFQDPLWSTGSTANSVVIIEAGSYNVTALDDQGCAVQDAIEIDLIDCKPIMPNVFSPNGDGSNDELTIERDGFVKAELQVFDRWGSMVWVGDPSMVGFRGVHYTTLEPLSEGAYFYVLRLDRTANRVEEIKGYFHIQR